jgi:hypothetical protein
MQLHLFVVGLHDRDTDAIGPALNRQFKRV